MTKSRWRWMGLGGLVAGAALGTSAAVAMGYWLNPETRSSSVQQESPPGEGGTPRSDSVAVVEQLEPPMVYVLPTFVIVGRLPSTQLTPPWSERIVAGAFPRIEDKPGQVAGTRVENPGVAIRTSALARQRERMVPRRSPDSLPIVSNAPMPSTLASELKDHRREIDRCAGRGMIVGGAGAPPTGKIAVRWVVRTDGSSDQVQVDENTLDDKKLSKCVLNAVNHWRFSPPAEGDAHLQSTFVFL